MRRKKPIFLLALLALAFGAIGLFLLSVSPVTVKAAQPAVPDAQKPDNTQCLGCHTTEGQVHQFANGDTVSVTVDPAAYDQGVHANLACQVCHTNISGFPHPENPAKSAKEYTLQYQGTCKQCHADQAEEVAGSAHAILAAEGNPFTPTCADCHNVHTQVKIQKDANGDPAASENTQIAGMCEQCHSSVVADYTESVHGKGVFEENNPDVPACQDCHGTHNISTARTEEFRLNSPQLCANCHSREDIMGKYGISTQVLNTYVADFHGTTITLFKQTTPDQPTNKPVCYDCHGIHNIASVDDPQHGLAIRQNMLISCQKCHPDATENFSESWLSHYIPSATKYPLVFYVQWFYRLFIPGVLGGMGIYVLSDVLRKFGITRRGKSAVKAKEE